MDNMEENVVVEKPKKTTTKKSTTKKPTAAKTTTATTTKVEEPAVAKTKDVRKFAPDERIECRSVTAGGLTHVGKKTGLQYEWSDYGDTCWVEYQDLQALQSLKSRFLVDPLFVIEDEELVEQWSKMLKPIYDKINNDDLDVLFTLSPKEFVNKLKASPAGFINTIKTRAALMIDNGELYDIRIIKAMDDVLGTEFTGMITK